MGGPRRGAALHAQPRDGLGGLRPGREEVEELGFEGPVERWRALRDQVHAEVCERGWNEELRRLHAVLRRHRPGRRAARDPERRLPAGGRPAGACRPSTRSADLRHGPLVDRYETTEELDGLAPGEGSFLACSFWLVTALALTGRRAGGARAVRGARRAAQRRRAARRGVRRRGAADDRQLPAGVQPPGAGRGRHDAGARFRRGADGHEGRAHHDTGEQRVGSTDGSGPWEHPDGARSGTAPEHGPGGPGGRHRAHPRGPRRDARRHRREGQPQAGRGADAQEGRRRVASAKEIVVEQTGIARGKATEAAGVAKDRVTGSGGAHAEGPAAVGSTGPVGLTKGGAAARDGGPGGRARPVDASRTDEHAHRPHRPGPVARSGRHRAEARADRRRRPRRAGAAPPASPAHRSAGPCATGALAALAEVGAGARSDFDKARKKSRRRR